MTNKDKIARARHQLLKVSQVMIAKAGITDCSPQSVAKIIEMVLQDVLENNITFQIGEHQGRVTVEEEN
jgi:hypothetical protein